MDEARNALVAILPEDARRDYQIVRAGGAESAVRSDMREGDTSIGYEDFSPHALWGLPYSILSVRVDPQAKDYFMYHGGEEILIPVAGAIKYRFFWTEGGTPPVEQDLDEPVRYGKAIRINPQIPHHAWGVGEEPARAWMVMRHASDSATALSSREEAPRPPRTIRPDSLRSPAQYALVAWGIAEAIRIHRERAELSVNQLAQLCRVDAGQLSRIERVHGSANVSLEALLRVASHLRLPLSQLLDQATWLWKLANLPDAVEKSPRPRPIFGRVETQPHRLHTAFLRIPDRSRYVPDAREIAGDAVSWIVLKGRAIIEMDTSPEIVDEGDVIHFRRSLPTEVEARGPTEILQITHSAVCKCVEAPSSPHTHAAVRDEG
jgi:transcriptional regulator with XRE-family HTH domain